MKHLQNHLLTKRILSLAEYPRLYFWGRSSYTRRNNKSVYSTIISFIKNSAFKKIFGINITFLFFASSLIPNQAGVGTILANDKVESPIVLTTKTGVQYPVNKIQITQSFKLFHPGIDLDGITGDEIRPVLVGKIEKVEISKFGYGKSILINHGGGFKSLYAHLSKIEVKEGQEVNLNTKIGEMGATGRASGDHLHLEIYQDGKTINPLTVLPKLNH